MFNYYFSMFYINIPAVQNNVNFVVAAFSYYGTCNVQSLCTRIWSWFTKPG